MKKFLVLILLGTAYLFGANGEELFKKCVPCHGMNAHLNSLGKSKIINTLTPDDIKKALKGYRSGELNQYGLGSAMSPNAKPLSDADIDALANYIPTLKK